MHHDKTYKLALWDEHFQRKDVSFPDSKVTAAQIVEAAGFTPDTDLVVLQHLKSGEIESLRPTELVDLGPAGIEDVFVVPPMKMKVLPGVDTAVFNFTTDIPFLDRWGTPLLIGPGSVTLAHTADEYVEVAELARAVDLYASLARQLLA